MRRCVNGHWLNDVCRCLEFWQGESCDQRDCGHFGIRNDTDRGLCYCQDGYAGQFCQFEVCLHRNQWYCNATRGTMDWTQDWTRNDWTQELHLCPPEIATLDVPENITGRLHCDCGFGAVAFSDNFSTSCLCHIGYYGEFCQWSRCPRGERWEANNRSCINSPFSIQNTTSKSHLGYFGYDINIEFDVSAAGCLGLILIFIIIGRIVLKCFEKRATRAETHGYDLSRRRSTFTEYFDRFHGRDPKRKRSAPNRKAASVAAFRPNSTSVIPDDFRDQPYTISGSTLPNAPVVVVPYRPNHDFRSATMTLETVYEGVPVILNPQALDEDDAADEVQEEKYRESMINFSRQISSDMSICSSTTGEFS